MALGLAAMRGINVDILLPENSNHVILDWARQVPLQPLIQAGCRIWLLPAPFDHSKLMTIDDSWSFIGSANWDTRSFRLNFELNVELHDAAFARQIVAATTPQRRMTVADIDGVSLPIRLRNSAARATCSPTCRSGSCPCGPVTEQARREALRGAVRA